MDVVEVAAENRKTVSALLDTGSLAGNFLSSRIVEILNAFPYVYSTKSHFSVCSGLDNTCYSSNKMLDLSITYVRRTIRFSLPFLFPKIHR